MAAKKSAEAKPATGTSAAKKAPAKAAGAKSTAKKAAAARTTPAKTTAPAKTAKSTKATKTSHAASANGTGRTAAPKKSTTRPSTSAAAKAAKTRVDKTPAAATRSAASASAKKTDAKGASSPFTKSELREFGKLIDGELVNLQREYDAALIALDDLQHNRLDTAGDDPADTGNKTFEREQEMSIANNRLHLITQLQRARVRVDEGTYGLCENCGRPIPKARLQAYPSATLCVDCKAREERR